MAVETDTSQFVTKEYLDLHVAELKALIGALDSKTARRMDVLESKVDEILNLLKNGAQSESTASHGKKKSTWEGMR